MNMIGLEQLQSLVVDPDNPNDVLKVDADPDTGEGGDDFYDMLRYGLMSRPIYTARPVRIISDIDRHSVVTHKPLAGLGLSQGFVRGAGLPRLIGKQRSVTID